MNVNLIDQLIIALTGEDPDQLEAAIEVIEDADLWHSAIGNLKQLNPPTATISERFHTIWTGRGHRIREKVGDDKAVAALLRIILPRYHGPDLHLYRGENLDRWERNSIGFAWTPREDVARMFGRGLNAGYGKGGLLLSTTVPAKAIIAGPSEHSRYLGEDEFVVDPLCLGEIVVLEKYSPS